MRRAQPDVDVMDMDQLMGDQKVNLRREGVSAPPGIIPVGSQGSLQRSSDTETNEEEEKERRRVSVLKYFEEIASAPFPQDRLTVIANRHGRLSKLFRH